jgi:hypothetical protein
MLLRRGPEDLPASPRQLQEMILLNALSGIVVLSTRYQASLALSLMVLDLVMSLGFTWLLLRALNRRPRFLQTATAVCGVDILYGLLLWPLLLSSTGENAGQGGSSLVPLLQLFMFAWELLVIAHIFRRAIESSMSSAIALSFALFIISITVTQLFFSGAQ